MFTNSLLETLAGMLKRQCDPEVTGDEYEDMLRMVRTEQGARAGERERLSKARQAAVDGPILPDPFNDPSNW